jgi:hypothetical protein
VVASTIGLLFLDTSLYIGPFATAANGIDLSWISATIIGAGLYFLAVKVFPEPAGVRDPALAPRTPVVDAVEAFATE